MNFMLFTRFLPFLCFGSFKHKFKQFRQFTWRDMLMVGLCCRLGSNQESNINALQQPKKLSEIIKNESDI